MPVLGVVEPKNGRDRLGIPDTSRHSHFNRSRQRKKSFYDKFVALGLGFSGVEALGQIDSHGLVQEAGADEEMEDALPAVGGEAGFLDQFALGGGQFILAFIDSSGGEFPEEVVGGIAVLTGEEHSRLVVGGLGVLLASLQQGTAFYGHDDHGPGMTNDVAAHGDAAGFFNLIGGDLKNRSPEGHLRGKDANRFLRSLLMRTWHRNNITDSGGRA